MPWPDFLQKRIGCRAVGGISELLAQPTARVEAVAGGRIGMTGQIAFEHDTRVQGGIEVLKDYLHAPADIPEHLLGAVRIVVVFPSHLHSLRRYDEPESATANCFIDEPLSTYTLGARGQVFDLIVIERSRDSFKTPATDILESTHFRHFESGPPVLIAPQDAAKFVGNTVLVACDGASQCARAVVHVLPFLRSAGDVLVLELRGGSVTGPYAQDLQAYLGRHKIFSQTQTVTRVGAEAAQVILDEASIFAADLMVKGAYTHSRRRQTISGAAAKRLLAASPVAMSVAH